MAKKDQRARRPQLRAAKTKSYADPRSESLCHSGPHPAAQLPLRPRRHPGQQGEIVDTQYHPARVRRSTEAVGEAEALPNALRVRWPTAWEINQPEAADFGQESIHGPDDRQRQYETDRYPWSAIASLVCEGRHGVPWLGTGFFISRSLLLTAGHCVYQHNLGRDGHPIGWAQRISVYPGRNGSQLPQKQLVHRQLFSTVGWVTKRDSAFDYGAIVVDPLAMGFGDGGYFGVRMLKDSELLQSLVTVAGYPGDHAEPGCQFYVVRRLLSLTWLNLTYDADTTAGQSGGPIFISSRRGQEVVGIHTTGGGVANWGLRINEDLWRNMTLWLKQAGT